MAKKYAEYIVEVLQRCHKQIYTLCILYAIYHKMLQSHEQLQEINVTSFTNSVVTQLSKLQNPNKS